MPRKARATSDPQSAFCEVCTTPVPRSKALVSEGKDYVAYFCSVDCYDRWQGKRAPDLTREAQEGSGRSASRDDRIKRAASRGARRIGYKDRLK